LYNHYQKVASPSLAGEATLFLLPQYLGPPSPYNQALTDTRSERRTEECQGNDGENCQNDQQKIQEGSVSSHSSCAINIVRKISLGKKGNSRAKSGLGGVDSRPILEKVGLKKWGRRVYPIDPIGHRHKLPVWLFARKLNIDNSYELSYISYRLNGDTLNGGRTVLPLPQGCNLQINHRSS
jgi:hypothetical protein